MKFTEQELNSFIELYKREFGDELSKTEALEQATALVSIVKLTYIPMTKKELEKSLEACKKIQSC